MTGESFKSLNRSKPYAKLEEALQEARVEFTDYANIGCRGKYRDRDDFSFDELQKRERRVETLEHELYCAKYEYEQRRTRWGA